MVTASVLLLEAKETPVIVGTTVSITNALLAPNELVAPGLARVRVALLPAASRIVPPFRANEFVAL